MRWMILGTWLLVAPLLRAAPVEMRVERVDDGLAIELCGVGRGQELRGRSASVGFVEDLRGLRWSGRRLRAVEDGCVGYRIAADRATSGGRRGLGHAVAGGWLLDPALWLWRPVKGELRLRVVEEDGFSGSMPWPRAADGSWSIAEGDSTSPAWTAFGDLDRRVIGDAGGRLRVAVLGARDAAHAGQLFAWVAEVAAAARTVHAQMPLPDAQLLVVPIAGRGAVPWGQTTRGGAAAVQLFPSRDATLAQLRADWVAAHELAHLFHPYLGSRGRWLAEGLASYYQNVLRARAGLVREDEAWRRLHAGFERGRRDRQALPLEQVSERMRALGANMRTYWSGAAFWLEADVALRARGQSLDLLLARFRDCCLPATRRWTPERFIAELDRLAGTQLLQPRFRSYARSHDFPDLEAVYALLGLRRSVAGLHMAQGSGAANLRREIMAARPPRG